MKLLILLLSLLIGVQSQTLEELKTKIEALKSEHNITEIKLEEVKNLIESDADDANVIEEFIWAAGNETERLDNSINDVTQKLKSCRTTKSACLEDEKKTKLSEKRLDDVKQEEEKHRSELKSLEDEQKYHPAKLDDLNRESNEIRNNSKLLEAELPELRLKLSKCPKESKHHKSTRKEKTDGGGFINKIVTSTLNKVQEMKKGIANAFRSKINLLKFNIPE